MRWAAVLAVAMLVSCNRPPLVSGPVDAALIQVEGIGMALASDDLEGAKKESERLLTFLTKHEETPSSFTPATTEIIDSADIASARDAFSDLSKHAVELARERPAFHVIHCPQAPQKFPRWIQMGNVIANPYLGGKNVLCGVREE